MGKLRKLSRANGYLTARNKVNESALQEVSEIIKKAKEEDNTDKLIEQLDDVLLDWLEARNELKKVEISLLKSGQMLLQ